MIQFSDICFTRENTLQPLRRHPRPTPTATHPRPRKLSSSTAEVSSSLSSSQTYVPTTNCSIKLLEKVLMQYTGRMESYRHRIKHKVRRHWPDRRWLVRLRRESRRGGQHPRPEMGDQALIVLIICSLWVHSRLETLSLTMTSLGLLLRCWKKGVNLLGSGQGSFLSLHISSLLLRLIESLLERYDHLVSKIRICSFVRACSHTCWIDNLQESCLLSLSISSGIPSCPVVVVSIVDLTPESKVDLYNSLTRTWNHEWVSV